MASDQEMATIMAADIEKSIAKMREDMADRLDKLRTQSVDATTAVAKEVASIRIEMATISSGMKDLGRIERELAEERAARLTLEARVRELENWKLTFIGSQSVKDANAANMGAFGRQFALAVMVSFLIGVAGTGLAAYIQLQSLVTSGQHQQMPR